MRLAEFIANRRGARISVAKRGRSVIAQAVSKVFCESLERRQLFTTYTYTVPSSHTVAYLTPNVVQYRVDVRLDLRTDSGWSLTALDDQLVLADFGLRCKVADLYRGTALQPR